MIQSVEFISSALYKTLDPLFKQLFIRCHENHITEICTVNEKLSLLRLIMI